MYFIVTLDESGLSERVELSSEATLEDLRMAISDVIFIDAKFQTIFAGAHNITLDYDAKTKLGKINVPERQLVVKHKGYSLWSSLLKTFENFKATNLEDERKFLYDQALPLITELVKMVFLKTYPGLTENFQKIQKTFITNYDRRKAAIEKSARVYFQKMHGNKCEISFSSRLDGTRRGVICSVRDGTSNTRYFIKTHHGGGAQDSNTREDLDIKELFAYKLLERLGVGAEIHLIPKEQRSKWVIYIGSREIDHFKTICDIENSDEDFARYITPTNQCLVLFTVLNMGDHHSLNMGTNKDCLPFIIDFFFVNRDIFNVKTDLYDKVHGADKINGQLGSYPDRIEVGKQFLASIDFSTKVDETFHDFLSEYRKWFKDFDIAFPSQSKTDDLRHYVQQIKGNASQFTTSGNTLD